MPLAMSPAGTVANIKAITGKDETRRFLAGLGFIVGDPVTVVSELNGDLIVRVKDTRVALSRSLALRILV